MELYQQLSEAEWRQKYDQRNHQKVYARMRAWAKSHPALRHLKSGKQGNYISVGASNVGGRCMLQPTMPQAHPRRTHSAGRAPEPPWIPHAAIFFSWGAPSACRCPA